MLPSHCSCFRCHPEICNGNRHDCMVISIFDRVCGQQSSRTWSRLSNGALRGETTTLKAFLCFEERFSKQNKPWAMLKRSSTCSCGIPRWQSDLAHNNIFLPNSPSPSTKGIASLVFPTQGLTDTELKQYDDIFADSFRAEIPSVSSTPVEEDCAALRI